MTMIRMQDKILQLVEAAAEAARLEPVRQPQWANTGTLYIQHGLATPISIDYDFQDHHASLTFSGPAVDEHVGRPVPGAVRQPAPWDQWVGPDRGQGKWHEVRAGRRGWWFHPAYDDQAAMEGVLSFLDALLAAAAPRCPGCAPSCTVFPACKGQAEAGAPRRSD